VRRSGLGGLRGPVGEGMEAAFWEVLERVCLSKAAANDNCVAMEE